MVRRSIWAFWPGIVIVFLLGSANLAAETSCAGFAIDGVMPGMTFRQVKSALKGVGRMSNGLHAGKTVTSAIYQRGATQLHVIYDRQVGRARKPRVTLVRQSIASSDGPRSVADALVSKLGQPTSGAASLADGLSQGGASWTSETCNLKLTATRRGASWWEPGNAQLVDVEVSRLTNHRAFGPSTKRGATRP